MSDIPSKSANSGKLAVFCLGGLRLERDGAPLTVWASRKAEALAVYLAVTRRAHEREALAALFWDNRTTSQALKNLSVLLTSLRANLGNLLLTTPHSVSLDWEQAIWVDATHLAGQLSLRTEHSPGNNDLARLEQAVTLYQGDFLAGFYLRRAAGFEEWALRERERLQQAVMLGLETLARGLLARRRYKDGIGCARRLLELDPLRESAHRNLMRLYALDGQRPAALAQYDRCFEILQQELGVEPDDETAALYEEIAGGGLPSPENVAEPAPPPSPRHNLPPDLTSFVGRTAELNQIKTRLDNPACHLLTLLGPGGVGKTRLALHAARHRTGHYLNGVWFVSLAPLTGPDEIAPAIAATMGFSFAGSNPPEAQLLHFLSDKETLLVLDNFEHLLATDGNPGDDPALALLCQILAAAPEVRLLVTSRRRLNLQAEWLLDVSGLPCPPPAEESRAGDYSAGQLLIRRVERVHPDFRLTPENQTEAGRICRLLDGLPLALELAASWGRTLSLAEIAAEIERSADFLAVAMPDLPARQRSLRAVFNHSWQMLAPAERSLFRKLAVFRGGFTARAAREVAEAGLPALSALADKSFLYREADGRYRRHPLTWQFAAEKLAKDPALRQATARRHARWYADLLSAAEAGLRGLEARNIVEKLQPEMENIRLAWQWAVAGEDTPVLERFVSPLFHLYALTGLLQAGQETFAAAARLARKQGGLAARLREIEARFLLIRGRFAQAEQTAAEACNQAGEDGPAEAWARLTRGEALWRQGEYIAARAELERALALAQTHRLPDVEAYTLRHIGIVLDYHDGNDNLAAQYFARSREMFREMGDARGETGALISLGIIYFDRGDFEQSKVYHGAALSNSRARGDRAVESIALNNLGNVYERVGEYTEALHCYEDGLRLSRELGKRQTEGSLLVNMGLLMHRTGNYARARLFYQQAREIGHKTQDPSLDGFCLHALSLLHTHLGEFETAYEHACRSLNVLEETGYQSEMAMALHHMGRALVELGRYVEAEDAFGRALALRQKLDEAVVIIDSLTGLALTAWRAGDCDSALARIDEVLARFDPAKASNHDEPGWVFITCYHILVACGDARAAGLLADAHAWLLEQTGKIHDPAMRASWLENIQANADIETAYLATVHPS